MKRFQIINGGKATGKSWLSAKNSDATKTAEILVYDFIGKDMWSNDGVGDKEFAAALKAIPLDYEITIRVNSQGGNVHDGLGIHSQVAARSNRITTIIDGDAFSTASWAFLSGKKVIIPENGAMMVHNPAVTYTSGDAASLRKDAAMLDAIKLQIVAMYRGKTGKTDQEISDAMDAETWFVGAQAKDWGLVDEVSKPTQITNSFDLSSFRRVPAALRARNQTQNKPAATPAPAQIDNLMNKEKIIALLKAQGVEVANDATNEQLQAALDTLVTNLAKLAKPGTATDPALLAVQNALKTAQDELKAIKDARELERVANITATVEKAITDQRITNEEKQKWIDICKTSEGAIGILNSLPKRLTGEPPAGVQVVAEDIRNLELEIVKNLAFHPSEPDRPVRRAALIAKNRDRLMQVMNTNTVSADLKRVTILQSSIRAFAKRLIPLSVFSTVFQNVPLQGTDEVVVPYWPLDTTASTDWVAGNGYNTPGNTNADAKKVTINKRKYQGVTFTSSEFRRLPYLNIEMSMMLKAEQLAVDVFTDVLSVVTNANYGAAAVTKLASAFGPDDVADLRTVVNQADWPETGRSLILDSAYDGALVKDQAIRAILSSGFDTLRTGTIPEIYGFQYFQNPRIPGNSENLVGFASFKSGIVAATAPIAPSPSVQRVLERYDVVTDPATGISFEYRAWGDPDLDTGKEFVEANYGYLKGEAAAIKRITSA